MKTPIKSNRQHIDRLRRHASRVVTRFNRGSRRIHSRIVRWCGFFDLCTFVMSVAVLVTLLIWVGFDHSEYEAGILHRILRWAQGVFTFSILFDLIFNFESTVRSSRIIRWVTNIAVLALLVPLLYPRPEHPWIPWLEQFLYANRTAYIVLAAYAVVDISYGVMHVLGKRMNPSMLLGGSFLVLILAGSFILMMPRCTYGTISYIDALFVSASGVCITGLTPVDIATTFTPLGQVVVAILFQLGALGIITFTSFFSLFFSGNQSIYNQLLIRDIVYSKTMDSLIPTLLYILGFTLTIEIIGAVAIYFTIPTSLGLSVGDSLWFSVFQSMSSFCNVGFTTLPEGLSTPELLAGNQSIYIVVAILVVAGGIGFPILVNIKDAVQQIGKRIWRSLRHLPRCERRVHVYDLNTKLVLTTTLVIFAAGSIAFFFLESDNTLSGMSLYDRIVQSFFNSTTPRSSGFASVNPADFTSVTLVLVMFQMWVGGASQSMAGGVKVNTLGTILLNLRSVTAGNRGVTAFGRNIAIPSVRRANAIVTLSILTTFVFTVTLLTLEPALSAKSLVFEVVSAVFTVGSSLGATPELSTASKGVLVVAMFIGRVGLLSLMSGLFRPGHDLSAHYPTDNVIIN